VVRSVYPTWVQGLDDAHPSWCEWDISFSHAVNQRRAAISARRPRCSTRSRVPCGWTSRPPSICTSSPARRRPARDYADVAIAADGTDELIDQFAMPAIVVSRCLDVLAANPLARALCPGFARGQNILRWRLLEPAARDFFVDWDDATDVTVSGLREAAGSDPDDPRLRLLIDELSAACCFRL
jgi:hypothetical protein